MNTRTKSSASLKTGKKNGKKKSAVKANSTSGLSATAPEFIPASELLPVQAQIPTVVAPSATPTIAPSAAPTIAQLRHQFTSEELSSLNTTSSQALLAIMRDAADGDQFETDFSPDERSWYDERLEQEVEELRAAQVEAIARAANEASRIRRRELAAERNELLAAASVRGSVNRGSQPNHGEYLSLQNLSIVEEAHRGVISVLDYDGVTIQVSMKQADFDKKRASVAVALRLCNKTQYDLLLGSTLDLTLSRVKSLFSHLGVDRAFTSLFGPMATLGFHSGAYQTSNPNKAPPFGRQYNDENCSPRDWDRNEVISIHSSMPSKQPSNRDSLLDAAVIASLEAAKDDKVLSAVCGLTECGDGVFTLAKFAGSGQSLPEWGGSGFALIEGAIKNLGMFMSFVFGSHMEVLANRLLRLTSDASIRHFCSDRPATLVILIDLIIKKLWMSLRQPCLDDDGNLVILRDCGWVAILDHAIGSIHMDSMVMMNLRAQLDNQSKSKKSKRFGETGVDETSVKSDDPPVKRSKSPSAAKGAGDKSESKHKPSEKAKSKSMCVAHCAAFLRVAVQGKLSPACAYGADCRFEHNLKLIDIAHARRLLKNSDKGLLSSAPFKTALLKAFETKFPIPAPGAGDEDSVNA